MVRVDQVLGGHALHQLQLHRQRVLARRQAGAVADAEDVRVDRHRRLAERHIEHHVGGLAAHAGQGLQRLARARHLAAMLLDEDAAGLDQVLRLGAEQADGADLFGDRIEPEGQHLLRAVGGREEPARGLVHAHVGGLCRQQHGGQQLEHVGVFELGVWLRVGSLKRGEERRDEFGFHRGGLCRLRARANAAATAARLASGVSGGSAASAASRSAAAGRLASRRRASSSALRCARSVCNA